MSTVIESPTLDPVVKTAAEFLSDLYLKGYDDADLRKYLIHTRGLSINQVDEAFTIHHNRLNRRAVEESSVSSVRTIGPPKVERQISNDAERPEKITTKPRTLRDNALSFLLPDKRHDGLLLIKDFLSTEWNYCVILQCLHNEYHPELVKLADQKRFLMTRKEADDIFRRIPELLKFHQAFYADLKEGGNIGRMFVRLLDFFKGYADYMKECTTTIHKMRNYTRDKRLWKCLKQIKRKSARKKDDMIDLLLVPLDRITDYRDFLTTLYGYADKSHKTDYEYLGKASRRIGRIARYIEEYKYGISNRHEMNKVQCFLGNKCDILNPTRRIVRRGMMIRRTTGWMSRNKHYIFFLFNDVLLWTTRKGELLNVVQLRKCELFESDSKSYPAKKFKVIVNMEKNKKKILLLECEYKRQRDEWYAALEDGIKTNKEFVEKAWSKGEMDALYVENHSDALEENVKSAMAISESKTENKQPEDINVVGEEMGLSLDESYDDRYEISFNFAHQEFKDFEAMDETVSQVSEFDQEFHQRHPKYREDNTVISMSPFARQGSTSSDHAGIFSFKTEHYSTSALNSSAKKNSSPDVVRKSSIIRRPSKTASVESLKLEKISSLKISLRDGNISREKDPVLDHSIAIRLKEFEKDHDYHDV